MKIRKIKYQYVFLMAALLLVGCQWEPGSHLNTSGKNIISVPQENEDINSLVDVYPITPQLI